MKITKLIYTFAFVFVFTTTFPQEAKQTKSKIEEKVQQRNSRNGTEGTTAVGDKIIIRNSNNAGILHIIEEQNSSASIKLFDQNDFNGIHKKLHNYDGKLFWGTEKISKEINHSILIGAVDFRPGNNSTPFQSNIGYGGAFVTSSTINTPLYARLNIPKSASTSIIIKDMTVYFKDNSTTNLKVEIMKEYFEIGGFALTSFVFTSSGASTIWQKSTITGSLLVESDGYYFIRVMPVSGNWSGTDYTSIKAIKINYTN